jgi:hypothetical protein
MRLDTFARALDVTPNPARRLAYDAASAYSGKSISANTDGHCSPSVTRFLCRSILLIAGSPANGPSE